MEKLVVHGGRRLHGSVKVQGSKNISLPIMAASILNEGISVIENCPCINDVFIMQDILTNLGCVINRDGTTLIIDSKNAANKRITPDMAGKLRASSVLMGPLLLRFGSVVTAKPGGCRIGNRPIDIHLEAFKRLGASWELDDENVNISSVRLHRADIYLRFPSVGATQNVIMASVKIPGITVIENAAREPEIIALCDYLTGCGADIQGAGESTVTVRGVEKLTDTVYTIPADRMVMGTYMAAAGVTKGDIKLMGCTLSDAKGFLDVYTGMGLVCEECDGGIHVYQKKRPLSVNYVKTGVYPGFPTDMQSVTMSMSSYAQGNTTFEECIFENRFGIAAQLKKMGADIVTDKNKAYVRGKEYLSGAAVEGTDLRGTAALFVAALAARGETVISNAGYINRGYENFADNYRKLGAEIAEI